MQSCDSLVSCDLEDAGSHVILTRAQDGLPTHLKRNCSPTEVAKTAGGCVVWCGYGMVGVWCGVGMVWWVCGVVGVWYGGCG